MNEITITQGLSFVHSYWAFMLPVVLCAAVNIGWVCCTVFNVVYAYVFREDKPKVDFWGIVAGALFDLKDSHETRHYSCYNYYHKSEKRPWFYLEFGNDGRGDYDGLWAMLSIIWPLFLLIIGTFFHFTPSWVLYGAMATWGTMFTARLSVDAGKKALSVMEALDIHKKDKGAH